MQDRILYDPWFIAIVTFFATVLLWPSLTFLINNIKACFGIFSGQYIGFTFNHHSGDILIENIICRQIRNELIGKIKGIAFFNINQEGKIINSTKNEGKYKLTGFVDERLLCISYKTKIKGLHSSGSIVVKSDSSGTLLSGSWSGVAFDSVYNAPYEMVKISKSPFINKSNDEIIKIAIDYLEERMGNTVMDAKFPSKTRFYINSYDMLGLSAMGKFMHNNMEETIQPGNIDKEKKHKKRKL